MKKELNELREKLKKMPNQRVFGTVKWFNMKNEYGFINHNDTREDIFVHHTAVARNNPQKIKRSVDDGDIVEFTIMEGVNGREAVNVTGHPLCREQTLVPKPLGPQAS